MLLARLTSGFKSWRAATDSCKSIEHSGSAVHRVLRRMQSRKFATVWRTWLSRISVAELDILHERSMRRVLCRITRRAVATAFRSWSRTRVRRNLVTAPILVVHVFGRLKHRALNRGFMTWRHKTVTKQHRNQIKALTLRSAFTCFGKAHTRTIARSWGRWLRIMARDGHVRSTATRLLRRLMLGQLACAVNTWRAVANTWREVANNWRTISMACVQRHTQALQASMIVYHRVLMHMLLRKLAVVWRTWCISVRSAKDDVVDRFSATTMRRLCLSFKRSHLLVIARCWTSWRNYLATWQPRASGGCANATPDTAHPASPWLSHLAGGLQQKRTRRTLCATLLSHSNTNDGKSVRTCMAFVDAAVD